MLYGQNAVIGNDILVCNVTSHENTIFWWNGSCISDDNESNKTIGPIFYGIKSSSEPLTSYFISENGFFKYSFKNVINLTGNLLSVLNSSSIEQIYSLLSNNQGSILLLDHRKGNIYLTNEKKNLGIWVKVFQIPCQFRQMPSFYHNTVFFEGNKKKFQKIQFMIS